MKHLLLTFSLLGLLSAGSIAEHSRAFFTAQKRFIQVIVNGEVVNYYPAAKVEVDYLPGGRHYVTVKVFGRRGYITQYSQEVIVKPGFTNHFSLVRNHYGDFHFRRTALSGYGYGTYGKYRYGHYYSPGIRYRKNGYGYHDYYGHQGYQYFRYKYLGKHHGQGKWLHGSRGHYNYGKGNRYSGGGHHANRHHNKHKQGKGHRNYRGG